MSENDNDTKLTGTNPDTVLLGRVKWFNSKAGYGFITITDGDLKDTDIFVHHSAINVSNQQYKYLVQGEYIELKLIETNNSKHQIQAADVCGIKSGKLMCETRNELKLARNNYKNTDRSVEMPRQQRPPNTSNVDSTREQESKDWVDVKKKSARGRPPRTTKK
jgi:CspA family cold shock protein